MIKALLLSLFSLFASAIAQADDYTRPQVRAITAFVRLQRSTTDSQIGEALRVLRETRGQLRQHGYEVQTIRIVTQPLPELVAGLSEAQALDSPPASNPSRAAAPASRPSSTAPTCSTQRYGRTENRPVRMVVWSEWPTTSANPP